MQCYEVLECAGHTLLVPCMIPGVGACENQPRKHVSTVFSMYFNGNELATIQRRIREMIRQGVCSASKCWRVLGTHCW